MIVARPTVSEERWLLLAGRYPALRVAVEKAGHGGGWKTTTWLARCLGFVLGVIACGMFAGVLVPFGSPWLVGGLLAMVAAEWLVAQRRVFRSGIEEALYFCGAAAVVVQILIWMDGNSEAFSVALFAAALLLIGWRLLNPLFTTVAAALWSLAIALVDRQLFDSRLNTLAAAGFCVVLAVAALIAGGREWRRPAHDRMLDGLVILMPWCANGWLIAYYGYRNDRMNFIALAVALAFFVANLATGVKRRAHAPLIGALGNLACAASAAFLLLDWPRHWELIVAGALLLVAAIFLDRRLRDRREGITSRPVEQPAGLDLAQLAAAAHLSPAPGAAPAEGMQGQGGDFGGGGASGRF